jgi:uncharacterized protein (TIGR00255 family)
MARSMTGFGRGSASAEGLSITVEVKTVNHKHLNIAINGSRSYGEMEAHLRGLLQAAFDRGSVQASLVVERSGALRPLVELDAELMRSYAEALKRLEAEIGEASTPKLPLLAALPGALTLREPALDLGLAEGLLSEATARAVGAVNESRQREGKTLSTDMQGRLETLHQRLRQVEPLGRESVAYHRSKLGERVRELLAGSGVAAPEDRLELEIVLLADRCDVTEEVARLRSHLDQFEALLGRDDAVGRRLDFLCQEMAREANTIGSKSQDARLAQVVVEMRAEIERIREQVQNLE